MGSPNAFIIKPVFGFWKTLGVYLSVNSDSPLFKKELYVPGEFYLGPLKNSINRSFVLNLQEFNWVTAPSGLEQYKENIENGKLKIVENFAFPQKVLDYLVANGKSYVSAPADSADALIYKERIVRTLKALGPFE